MIPRTRAIVALPLEVGYVDGVAVLKRGAVYGLFGAGYRVGPPSQPIGPASVQGVRPCVNARPDPSQEATA